MLELCTSRGKLGIARGSTPREGLEEPPTKTPPSERDESVSLAATPLAGCFCVPLTEGWEEEGGREGQGRSGRMEGKAMAGEEVDAGDLLDSNTSAWEGRFGETGVSSVEEREREREGDNTRMGDFKCDLSVWVEVPLFCTEEETKDLSS